MKPIHDIRQQIPQFSANFFAPYVYQPYPRMMVNKETGKPYKDKANHIVIVNSEQEEAAFWASQTVSVPQVAVAKAIDIPSEQPVVAQAMAIAAVAPADAPVREKRKYTRKLPADLK